MIDTIYPGKLAVALFSAEDMAAALERINQHASKPFREADVFAFRAVAGTGQLTSYASHIGVSSLRNAADDLAQGRPYLLDHNTDGTYGYTYEGEYDEGGNLVRASVFIPRHQYPRGRDGKATNAEIEQIERGLRREVSLGLGGPAILMRCDVCGNDLTDFAACPHVPGRREEGKLNTYTIENARAVELSGAWAGACPGAVIEKAYSEFTAGRTFSRKEFTVWLDAMEVKDPSRYFSVPSGPPSPSPEAHDKGAKGNHMKNQIAAALAAIPTLSALRNAVLGAPDDNAAVSIFEKDLPQAFTAAVQTATEAAINADPLRAECLTAGIKTPEDLKQKLAYASAGVEAEEEARKTAQAEAIRAFGAPGAKDHEETIKAAPLALAKALAKTFKATADEKYGIGKGADGGGQRLTSPGAGDADAGTKNFEAEREAARQYAGAANGTGKGAK
jgi:hypothetical protein